MYDAGKAAGRYCTSPYITYNLPNFVFKINCLYFSVIFVKLLPSFLFEGIVEWSCFHSKQNTIITPALPLP